MRKSSMKISCICIAAAAAVGCLGASFGAMADASSIKPITSADRTALLGTANADSYFLGIASQFSVFVQDDFAAEGSDCEGRLGAGGNANMGDIGYDYSVGAKLDDDTKVAHVVVGGNTLQKFQPNGKNFVVGKADNVDADILEYASLGQCNVYEGELIDFDKEFELLRTRSRQLADMQDNATLEIDPNYISGWTVRGSDPELNILTLTAEQVEEFNEVYVEFSIYIPEGSYLVINVEGDAHVDMPGNEIRLYDENGKLQAWDETHIPVLYNLADATSFKYLGSLFGSTLAPNADGSGDEGGHIAGSTFAKSFKGGIEFGYSFFNMGLVEAPDVEEGTTTLPAGDSSMDDDNESGTTGATVLGEDDLETTSTEETTSDSTSNDTSETSSESSSESSSSSSETSSETTSSSSSASDNDAGSSPTTGDAMTGGVFVAAGAALFAMTAAIIKRKES